MIIETERMKIVALTPEQLELLVSDTPRLEEDLQCLYQGQEIQGIFREILLGQVKKSKEDPDNYLWHSFWLIIRKADNIVVGTVDFKNIPDKMGNVEIGYGLGENYEHHGYMTETVQAMCHWAKRQKGVLHVIAETELDGFASERILRRCGFTEYSRDTTVWWKSGIY